jgi:hypothetical protein
MRDETYGGAFYPPNKEPLIIRCNGLTKTDELDALQKTLQKQAGDKPVILLPYYCDIVKPPAQMRWIPCDERLPGDYQDVLVWFEYYRYGSYNRMYSTYGIGTYSKQYDSWMVNHESGWKDLRVIAWMPLPQPYKGEQE